ncbi:MAG: hypothetical protein LBD21_05840, partial [Tannerellaceae bacterium]|nr:hypothetical protein [Tannerellaceae bacterium]
MKTIDITKTEITLLRNSEHGLASKAVNEAYAAKLPAAGDAILTAYHQKFNTKVLTEEAMLKSIWASEHTPRMEYFHHERGLAMSTVCRLVDSAAEATFEPARK